MWALYSKIVIKLVRKHDKYRNRFRLHLLRALGADVAKSAKAYGRFTVANPSNLTLGDHTTINEGVHINCRESVHIGNRVRLSTNVQIHTGKLILDSHPRLHSSAPVTIGDDVWIASGCVVSAGVTIGKSSVIAANSVVLSDVEENSLYAGSPAKKVKSLQTIKTDPENRKAIPDKAS